MIKKWTTIILAGGFSRRMGTSKALLSLGSVTAIEHLVKVYQPFSRQIIIISNQQDEGFIRNRLDKHDTLHIVLDDPLFKGDGPLAGIYTGMKAVQDEWYFISACDLVQMDSGYLKGICSLHAEEHKYNAFIPICKGRLQPLAGLYKNNLAILYSLLSSGERKLTFFVSCLDAYIISEEEWRTWTEQEDPFFNMNEREDYLKIKNDF